MVAQKMGSQRGGSNSVAETRIQSQDGLSDPLSRQGSLYSLTLDEVQNHLGDLGKPLSSMNLNELLKTVWTAEGNHQSMGNVHDVQQRGQPAASSYLSWHSRLMLSVDLSKKMVDEVWHDIIHQEEKRNILDKKVSLGEVTLEDFLVKAGVVAEPELTAVKKTQSLGSTCGGGESMGLSLQAQCINCPVPSVYSQMKQQLGKSLPGHSVQRHITLVENPTMDTSTYPETRMTMVSSPRMGTLLDTQMPGRKRVAPGDVAEISVERRQKRMIKNRESAARSRARKQAYTQELENKISRLEEEIERLKTQKELVKVLPVVPLPEPKHRLRRTSSAPV